jgi:hypothetical protein
LAQELLLARGEQAEEPEGRKVDETVANLRRNYTRLYLVRTTCLDIR